MLAYRIVHKSHGKSLIASGLPGRWNSVGNKVVYCAESVALAMLENMVRRQGVGFNTDFCTMVLEIPGSLNIQVVKANELEAGWRNIRDYTKCQPIGNAWYNEKLYPVLKVPSAVLPESANFVLNTTHKDFKKVKVLHVAGLVPDTRIEEILKARK